jgi:hypothetical protein
VKVALLAREYSTYILFTILLLSSGCTSSSQTVPTSSPGEENGEHIVVEIQGSISVKRVGWTEYAPATFGTSLAGSELLRVQTGSTARIVCADFTLGIARSGVNHVPCSSGRHWLSDGDPSITPPRTTGSINFPLLLSPRKTKIATPYPVIRWTPMTAAEFYSVTVRGLDHDWTTRVLSPTTSLVYPDDAPELLAGHTYRVIVVGGGHSSEEEGTPDLGFTLLDAAELQELRSMKSKIRQLDLDANTIQFLEAHVYASQGAYADAMETLRFPATSLQAGAVHRYLGYIKLKVGLTASAAEDFTKALRVSTEANDIEGKALALRALGRIHSALGNKDEAISNLREASVLYKSLGDSEIVDSIEEELADLQ